MAQAWRRAVKGGEWPDVPIDLVAVSDIVRWTTLTRTEANHLYYRVRLATNRSGALGGPWIGWEDRKDVRP